MKKVMLTLGVLLCTLLAVAQASAQSEHVYKLRAQAYATYILGDWGPWEECSVLIVIDLNRERIKIHSETLQEYDIVEVRDADSYGSLHIDCIDQDGDEVVLTLYSPDAPDDQENNLYIRYEGLQWVYHYTVLN